jgi:hypothetical protein
VKPGAFARPKDDVTVQIVGIDCATVDAKIGIALGEAGPREVVVSEVRLCTAEEKAADLVTRWLREALQRRSLLAIDAPLGWPKNLLSALAGHRAGEAVSVEPNLMFRRATDRFVHDALGKTPLEIGADRIARTAHSALRLLADVGQRIGAQIPLAWDPSWTGIAAIEVYPAATLLARKMMASGYKKRSNSGEREGLVRDLRAHMKLPESCQSMADSADALDAAICVLAGGDFVQGHVHPPLDHRLAEHEGWIWFRAGSGAG